MSCTEVEIAPEYEYVIIYYSNKYANIYTGYICVWVVGSVGSAFSIWKARALLRLLFACSHVQFSENERSVGSGGFDANACVFFVFVFFSFCFLCVFNIDAADGEEKRETYTNARVWAYLLNICTRRLQYTQFSRGFQWFPQNTLACVVWFTYLQQSRVFVCFFLFLWIIIAAFLFSICERMVKYAKNIATARTVNHSRTHINNIASLSRNSNEGFSFHWEPRCAFTLQKTYIIVIGLIRAAQQLRLPPYASSSVTRANGDIRNQFVHCYFTNPSDIIDISSQSISHK